MDDLKVKLSASRLKTLKSCSLKYFYNYTLKIPQQSNTGNRVGDCVHIVLECLGERRHRKLLDKLIAAETCFECPVIWRFIQKYCKRESLSEESLEKIDKFILIGAKSDFLCEKNGGKLVGSEIDFDIKQNSPTYRIAGFIDQIASYPGNYIRIKDFKSQAREMEGDDKVENVQAYIYALAAKNLYGEDKKVVVDFLMLNFPENPIFRLKFSDEDLARFKKKLAEWYEEIATFTPENRFDNVAKNQKFPAAGEGFKGPLQCGWAGAKKGFVASPDQKKKNGEPAYYCAFRFPLDYFALCDEDGNVVATSFNKDLKVKEGQFIVKKHHKGCEAFLKKG